MGKKSKGLRADFDGAWKQTLDRYLDPFLRLCFPIVHAGIDWLLHLPEEQRIEFRRELIEYEASKHMPYITSIEEMGRQEGRRKGRQEGHEEGFRKGLRTGAITTRQKAVLDALEIRFGPAPGLIRRSIEALQDEARLRSLHRIAIQATSLEAFARGLEG